MLWRGTGESAIELDEEFAARGWTLDLPARWPWHGDYINALNRIRALPAAA